MLLIPDHREIEAFKTSLDKIDMPIQVYKMFEVILRQAMMISDSSRYQYDKESPIESIRERKLPPEQRFKKIQEYIRQWERNNGREYGFNYVVINEIADHTTLLMDYLEAIAKLREVFDIHKEMVDADLANHLISDMEEQLKKKLQVHGRPVGRYFAPESKSLKIENFDYFSRYIGFSFGIYSSYYKIRHREGDARRNHFFTFLAEKINFENTLNQNLKMTFTSRKIADRIKNNKKGYEILAEQVNDLGLIDDAFIEYIASNRNLE